MKRFITFLAVTLCGSAVSGALLPASSAAESLEGEQVRTVTLDFTDASAKQPQAVVDDQGRIHIVFGRGNEVRCATSIDAGKTYQVTTVGKVGALALGMRRGPRISATSGALIVTAIGGNEGKGRDGDLMVWRSGDAGATWTGPTKLNTPVGSAREGLHGMAAATNGAVYCAWLDLRNKRMEIYGARSKDGGLTWEPDVLAYRSPERSVCECCHPSVAFAPDATLYLMWRNQLGGARDLHLARSSDGGKSFGEAEKLGRGTWLLNACPMDGGAVAVGSKGQVETVWMRAGTMYTARPGEEERELGRGVQGWAAYGPGGIYSVWLEKRPGKLLAGLPGEKSPMILAEHANDPVIAAALDGQGLVVAVWESTAERGGLSSRVLTTGPNTNPR